MNETCYYCGKDVTHMTRYEVRRAVKPPGTPFRWETVGWCCERCEQGGWPLRLEATVATE